MGTKGACPCWVLDWVWVEDQIVFSRVVLAGSDFRANEYYCVGAPGSSTTTTTGPTSTAVVTPSPVQSGIDPQCTKYAEAASGDNCPGFAAKNGITATELYSWNPVLGAGGANCNSDFWANEYYCVGAAGS